MVFRLYSFLILGLAVSSGSLAAPVAETSLVPRQQHTGTATYYFQGGAYGACGQQHSDADHIVALSPTEYAGGANCGRTITLTNTDTGVTATGVVADLCPGCRTVDSIDLSEGLFTVFTPESQGIFPVAWVWN